MEQITVLVMSVPSTVVVVPSTVQVVKRQFQSLSNNCLLSITASQISGSVNPVDRGQITSETIMTKESGFCR